LGGKENRKFWRKENVVQGCLREADGEGHLNTQGRNEGGGRGTSSKRPLKKKSAQKGIRARKRPIDLRLTKKKKLYRRRVGHERRARLKTGVVPF